tara:strand:- start:100 stop:252 length:153 start_codon:yes stop_codon:yes gene_type:complete
MPSSAVQPDRAPRQTACPMTNSIDCPGTRLVVAVTSAKAASFSASIMQRA